MINRRSTRPAVLAATLVLSLTLPATTALASEPTLPTGPAPLVVASTGAPGTTITLSATGAGAPGAVTFSLVQGTANCVLHGDVLNAYPAGWCAVVATQRVGGVEATSAPSLFYFMYVIGAPVTSHPRGHRRR